ARHNMKFGRAVMYPVMVASAVPTYRLVPVKIPQAGGEWDEWSLSRKLLLEKAVDKWLAIRSLGNGYREGEPDPAAIFPEVVFPEWSVDDWLEHSFINGNLVLWDANHPILKEVLHLT